MERARRAGKEVGCVKHSFNAYKWNQSSCSISNRVCVMQERTRGLYTHYIREEFHEWPQFVQRRYNFVAQTNFCRSEYHLPKANTNSDIKNISKSLHFWQCHRRSDKDEKTHPRFWVLLTCLNESSLECFAPKNYPGNVVKNTHVPLILKYCYEWKRFSSVVSLSAQKHMIDWPCMAHAHLWASSLTP